MLKCLIVLFGITFVFAPTPSYGQPEKVVRIPSDRTVNCEFSTVILGGIPFSPEDEVLILSYRGKIDTVRGIEQKRLKEAESYLGSYGDESFGEVWRANITGAIANKKRAEGQLDFYVNGVLRLSMSFIKNREARFGSCAEE